MTSPQEPAPDTETDVTPGDVTQEKSDDSPADSPDASSDVEDGSATAPLDADEGDPDPDTSVPAG